MACPTQVVKATREKRWGKVKSLQWLLPQSFSGKALAVKRVTGNKGKRTSGVDRVLWSAPDSKHKAIGQLQRREYFEQRVLLKRIVPEIVEQHAFLISNNEQPPVVKTGSAPAEL